jgi:Carboxypeptidase regulatory-like domain
MHIRLAGAAFAAVSCLGLRSIGAQEPPARLPAVVVNAAPPKPGSRKMAGVARDTTGFPIDGVEITIASSQRRATTTGSGEFRFENIAPGSYEVRARKLGYAPQVRTIVVDSAGGSGAFAMMSIPVPLLPVISSAARGGLSGVVGDTAFRPLPGAKVSVIGHSDMTLTDSTGAFYIPVRPGNYTVAISEPGFDFKVVGVIVPSDSGRRITAYLTPQSHLPSVREVHNLEDFATRMAWRTVANSKVFTRAELEEKGIEWVNDAVQMGSGWFGGREHLDRDCAAVKNGGPSYVNLESLTVEEIETVEVYKTAAIAGPAPMPPGQRARVVNNRRVSAPQVQATNSGEATLQNRGKHCALVYVWLR